MEATLEQLNALPSETPESPNTEVSPPVEEPLQPSSDLQEFLQSQGIADAAPEGDDPSAGDEAADELETWIATLPEEAREKARELATEKRQKEKDEADAREQTRLRGLQTQRERYQSTGAALREYFKPIVEGQREFSQQDLDRLLATFNNYNNDILSLVREEPQAVQQQARATFIATQNKALEKVLPQATYEPFKEKTFSSSEEFLKEVVSAARKDYKSPAQHNAAVKEALLKYEDKLIKAGRLNTPAGRAPASQNVSKPSGTRSPAEILDDPTSTSDEKEAAFEQLYGIKYPR